METSRQLSSVNTLDEFGRVLLPAHIREHLKWETGQTLTVFANLTAKFIELLKQEGGQLTIDCMGRISVKDFASAMKWISKDKLQIKVNKEAQTISISLAE